MEGKPNDSGPRTGIYKRLFARFYDRTMAAYEERMAQRKRELFCDVSGTVLEIGAGTGANLPYLSAECRWVGVEPNSHMHEFARRRATEAGIEADLRTADAGGMDVEDAIADVAISTLVLCSVGDADAVLAELRRALKPGGRFLFIEHVAAPRGTALRFAQHVLNPVQYAFADGCRVNRDTALAIERAGFASVRVESFRAPKVPPWVSPHIAGWATR